MNDFEIILNDALVDTFNIIMKYEESSLKKILKTPVTITEAHIIEAVGKQENKKTTVSELAALLDIAMPTATIAVKKLESKGFIKKVPCETDGRRIIISLTDMGKKIDRIHQMFHNKMVKNISSQFKDSEKEILLKAVKTLNEYFRTKVKA